MIKLIKGFLATLGFLFVLSYILAFTLDVEIRPADVLLIVGSISIALLTYLFRFAKKVISQ